MRADTNSVAGMLGIVTAVSGAVASRLDVVEQWIRICSGIIGIVAGVLAAAYYLKRLCRRNTEAK